MPFEYISDKNVKIKCSKRRYFMRNEKGRISLSWDILWLRVAKYLSFMSYGLQKSWEDHGKQW